MKRKEKEHLKQDPFVHFLEQVADFLKRFRKPLLYAAGAVALVLVVVLALVLWNNFSSSKDNEVFSAALKIKNSSLSIEQKIESLQRLSPRRGASAAITLFTASLFYEKGDTAKAQETLRAYRSSRIGWLNDQERMLEANLLAAAGQTDQAIAAFDALVSAPDRQMGADQVLLSKAQLLTKAGRKDEAGATLKKIIAEYPETLSAYDARQQLATLEESAT